MNVTTQAKHTPGPWRADGARNGTDHYYQIDAPTPEGVSAWFPYTVCSTDSHNPAMSREEDEANARLIASAPELLEALKVCLSRAYYRTSSGNIVCRSCTGATTSRHTLGCMVAQAEAAVAKAEGGAQ
jgi:hypothetical protein